MAPTKMSLRTDEERGKKDDDHRVSDQTRFRPLRRSSIPRLRRVIVVLIALFLVYEFFKHMPTGLTPAAERYNPKIAALKHQNPRPPPGSVQSPTAPKVQVPPKAEINHKESDEQPLYDGKIHFYELAQSLPRKQRPATLASEAVMFAAASLHSVSDMLPLACGMAVKRLNHVHFVLMGKEDVSIEGIKQVNGIRDPECPITWHVWNDVRVDMVVHASEYSSSLIRLIRSLDGADYLGTKPSLTIELPPWVDANLLGSLQSLNGLSQLKGRITLRRRIQPHYMGPVESSLRTVESFYPLNPKLSHLLMLSPQTELAPSFYHYLKYSILFYKQSARAQQEGSELLGISLDLPSAKPTSQSEAFAPPVPQSSDQTQNTKQKHIPSFLWQAPNSNAALYFGDKWAEFHTFVSSRLAVSEAVINIPSQDKLISTKYPAFMEYLLEMMRAKGYYMIYPSFPGRTASPLATVHTDLYHPPEEFAHEPGLKQSDSIEELLAEKPVARAHTIMPLLDTFELGHSFLGRIPLVSYDAERLTEEMLQQRTVEYAKNFRVRYGGCSQDDLVEDPSAYLFCRKE
ncbi:hypothetical protein PENSUB_3874 [Penicillium subrubescens]|uniref:Uncharacterized protein n=1 Tax=Penicillium subrubescens TaxID=1316194 RepID=A0A1Q5UDM0_9EURO|nr:hypothetical protein PENSUB_3874 [Penicillium subrubescens]